MVISTFSSSARETGSGPSVNVIHGCFFSFFVFSFFSTVSSLLGCPLGDIIGFVIGLIFDCVVGLTSLCSLMFFGSRALIFFSSFEPFGILILRIFENSETLTRDS